MYSKTSVFIRSRKWPSDKVRWTSSRVEDTCTIFIYYSFLQLTYFLLQVYKRYFFNKTRRNRFVIWKCLKYCNPGGVHLDQSIVSSMFWPNKCHFPHPFSDLASKKLRQHNTHIKIQQRKADFTVGNTYLVVTTEYSERTAFLLHRSESYIQWLG